VVEMGQRGSPFGYHRYKGTRARRNLTLAAARLPAHVCDAKRNMMTLRKPWPRLPVDLELSFATPVAAIGWARERGTELFCIFIRPAAVAVSVPLSVGTAW
jgi:hypothetical protein